MPGRAGVWRLRHGVLALGLCFTGLLSCHGKSKRLEVRSQCRDKEVVSCLQDYAYERLGSRDIERLIGEAIPRCLSRDLTILARQSSCLPLEMGRDEKGRTIVLLYRCDDVCPGSGSVIAIYGDSISPEACCAEGAYAYPVFSAGKRYGGCGPREILSEYESRTGKPHPNLFCNKPARRRKASHP